MGGCTGWLMSDLVDNQDNKFTHNGTHLFLSIGMRGRITFERKSYRDKV